MSDQLTRWLVGIFSLLVAAAGWFYMLYSRAAHHLAAIEEPAVNRRRIVLRRIGGSCMMVLGATFYVGCDALLREDLRLAAWMMLAVFALMAVTLVLGLIDLRLTRALRRRRDRG